MRPPTENTDDQYTDPRSTVEQAALDGLAEAMARYSGQVKLLPSCTYGAKLVGVKERTRKTKTSFALVVEGTEQSKGKGSNLASSIEFTAPRNRAHNWREQGRFKGKTQ